MSCKHGEWPPCDLCDEVDAAFKSGYEEGGKLSIDLTMKHLQRAEKAEQANRRMVELLKEPSDDALQRAGAVVGPMNGYEGESPDADHFEWFKAMSAELLKEVE